MKFKIDFKILIVLIIFAFLVNSCTNKEFESKSTTVNQEINHAFTVKSALKVGDAPHDFTVVTTDAKVVRLSDFTKNEKPVIVYFMATWCPWCEKDYSALSKVYKDYENKVSILSISLDLGEDLNTLREYKKKYPELQKTIFASGQTEILVNYRVTKTTTKYAIDKNGKIGYIEAGAFDEGQWRILLDKLSK